VNFGFIASEELIECWKRARPEHVPDILLYLSILQWSIDVNGDSEIGKGRYSAVPENFG